MSDSFLIKSLMLPSVPPQRPSADSQNLPRSAASEDNMASMMALRFPFPSHTVFPTSPTYPFIPPSPCYRHAHGGCDMLCAACNAQNQPSPLSSSGLLNSISTRYLLQQHQLLQQMSNRDSSQQTHQLPHNLSLPLPKEGPIKSELSPSSDRSSDRSSVSSPELSHSSSPVLSGPITMSPLKHRPSQLLQRQHYRRPSSFTSSRLTPTTSSEDTFIAGDLNKDIMVNSRLEDSYTRNTPDMLRRHEHSTTDLHGKLY